MNHTDRLAPLVAGVLIAAMICAGLLYAAAELSAGVERTRAVSGDGVIVCPCREVTSHDPHFYISAIGGGPPGPIPQVTCLCVGRLS